MATITRNFEALDVSTIDGGSSATVTNTGQYSEFISLAAFEGAHCWVEADFPDAVDDLVIEVYGSPDGSEELDTIPLMSFTIPTVAVGLYSLSFIVTQVYAFKVKFYASGSTSAISVTFKYRRWNWTSS